MKKYNIGILGATGAVGREMLNVLSKRAFPVGKIKLFASENSSGKKIVFNNEKISVETVSENSFRNLDFVFGATSGELSELYSKQIVDAGAVFIDNSSRYRKDPNVPLIVPEVNPEDINNHRGIISNPNCTTVITLVAVNAINKMSKIKSMTVSTYQATSGAGADGPKELKEQMEAVVNNRKTESNVFPYQIVENVIPQIGEFLDNGYTAEEMKMQSEGRRILHSPDLKVSCTCVRVPVVRSHSVSVSLITEDLLDTDTVKKAIANEKGCLLCDSPAENIYPMPLFSSHQDSVLVGRIRKDLINENGINLWCCGDQLRKGAATNAVQIAEFLIKQ